MSIKQYACIANSSCSDKSKSISLEKEKKSEFELSLENLKPTISKYSDVSSKKEEIDKDTKNESEIKLKVEDKLDIKVNSSEEKVVAIDVEVSKEEEHETVKLNSMWPNNKVRCASCKEFVPFLEIDTHICDKHKVKLLKFSAVVADKARNGKKGIGFDAYAMEWKNLIEEQQHFYFLT